MPMELEEIKKQLDEALKLKKDYGLSFTVLESQIRNLKGLIGTAKEAYDTIESKRKTLAETFESEKKALIDALNSRASNITSRENELANAEELLRKAKNLADIERNSLVDARRQCDELKEELKQKLNRVNAFLENAKEVIGQIK